MIDVMNINANYIFMYYDPRFRDLKPSKQSLTILEVSQKKDVHELMPKVLKSIYLKKNCCSSFLRVDILKSTLLQQTMCFVRLKMP